MKNVVFGLSVFGVLGLIHQVSAQPAVEGGTLHFRGSIVERMCELGTGATVTYGAATQLINVTPSVVLAVNRATRLCRLADLPFVATYQVLEPADLRAESPNEKGVVTISYL